MSMGQPSSVRRLAATVVTMAAEVIEAGVLTAVAAAGAWHPWIIYLTAGFEACRLAFDIPARTAFTTALVHGEALLSAQSLSAVVWSSASLAGPAVGGLLLATTGAAVVFAVNGVSTAAALVAFLPLRRATPVRRSGRGRHADRHDRRPAVRLGAPRTRLPRQAWLSAFDLRPVHASSSGVRGSLPSWVYHWLLTTRPASSQWVSEGTYPQLAVPPAL
jgi:hypothetical protein